MSATAWIIALTVVLVLETGILVIYTPFAKDARAALKAAGKAVRTGLLRAYHSVRPKALNRDAELRALVTTRFAAIPLREAEITMLGLAVQWALTNPLDDPFSGHEGVGVATKQERRQNTQLFHMPIAMAGAYQGGSLESDQTYETLSDALKLLQRLVEEVRYDADYWHGRTDQRRYRA